jgi:hypothetical protein
VTEVDCEEISVVEVLDGRNMLFAADDVKLLLSLFCCCCCLCMYCCVNNELLFLSGVGVHDTLEFEEEEDNGGFVNPVGGGG